VVTIVGEVGERSFVLTTPALIIAFYRLYYFSVHVKIAAVIFFISSCLETTYFKYKFIMNFESSLVI
jgi:hypothetical protein